MRITDYVITLVDGVWNCYTKIDETYINACGKSSDEAYRKVKKKVNKWMIEYDRKTRD